MKLSDIISVIALLVSIIVPVYLFGFDKFSDEIIPKKNRSVDPGLTHTIYISKFDKEHDIVIDLCNINKNTLSEPGLGYLPDSTKKELFKTASEQSKTRKSILYILDSKKAIKDSVIISCFQCITVGITVPPKGSLVLQCVCGCLNNFCSYEFIKL
jgi:hypothetical protein